MKTIIIFFGFFLINVFVFLEVEANYHDAVGIPAAKKIKELEEAMQADGTINIESRIIGGERAPHPYPFFAGLIISLIGKMESFCGSSLLSSNRVVTAAHCYFDRVHRASKFEVVLGSNLLYQGGDRHVTRHVQVHPYYDPEYLTNDVAILYLPQNVRFTNLVHPIRLPNNYEQTNTFEGYTAVAVGFGYTKDDEQPKAATVLSHVELQVIDDAQCAYYFGLILPNTICTSGIGIAGSVGVCYGDSGGPLFVLDSNRDPVLAGLIISLIGKPLNYSACGSSLLSSNRVVTAAHCYFDGADRASKFEVVLGSNLLYQGGERHITRHVQVHPYYDPKFLTNDVAILYLPQNVRFTNLVHPIRLPTNYEQTNTFVGYMAVAVGFGKTSSKQPSAASVLSHVELQVIDNAQCAASYNIYLVTPNTICTSGIGIAGSVGVCSGDSGGPLFVLDSNRDPVLIGITSFVRNETAPCVSGSPSGYSRVTSFMNFIKQHLY
ncbi:hypothetical protein SFRURICE_000573 [Spodoptera frugiperda]|nr:hypothetical protein SFRURICE_000573 [Spodoptera frugiperda]